MAKITNKERLRQKLLGLPNELQKGIVDALAKGAQEIVDMQYHLCPYEHGDLRNSIDWTFGEVPIEISHPVHVQSQADKENLKVTIYAGNEVAYYARWVEFGTRPSTKGQRVSTVVQTGKNKGRTRTRIAARTHPGHAAQPFFFPGYRANKKRAIARIVRASNAAMKIAARKGGAP